MFLMNFLKTRFRLLRERRCFLFYFVATLGSLLHTKQIHADGTFETVPNLFINRSAIIMCLIGANHNLFLFT
jgi:hypothetical protein